MQFIYQYGSRRKWTVQMFIRMPILVALRKGLENQSFREANFVKLPGPAYRQAGVESFLEISVIRERILVFQSSAFG